MARSFPYSWLATFGTVASLAVHVLLGSTLVWVAHRPSSDSTIPKTVKITLKEERAETVEPAEPPPPPPPQKPKPKKKAGRQKEAQASPAQPVLGLSRDSFDDKGSGNFQAPVGNTLAMEDDGRRLDPDQIRELDQSADPVLIRESVQIPEYTQAAIDAGLEGVFIVDVFVDARGTVSDAVPRTNPGYGMSERLIAAARLVRYVPRKDAQGNPISGWADLKFRLEIP